ncbi:uncharacterized protein LOC134182925 [Corticium candelabrum]|uniref:uncharacterized protein LOC134182925 n=1 Tax=Corticium candelabrum TaxID=121492 RepID=UPI002E276130|nr:uncharacterized protein LOC134182925 [Corticium candelabrum]
MFNPDFRQANLEGETALHVADDVEVVDYLLIIGLNVEARDEDGYTPFLIACRDGRLPVVQRLIQSKCNKAATTNDGSTALHLICSQYVVRNDHLSVVKLLTSLRVDVSAKNNAGKTAIQVGEESLQSDQGSHKETRSAILSHLKEFIEESAVAAVNPSPDVVESANIDVQLPSAIDRLGPSVKSDYENALKKGELPILRGNIDMFGEEDAGKSSLGDSYLDEPFIDKRESTRGAHVKVMRIGGGSNTNWKELKPEDKEQIIDQVLVRGYHEYVEKRHREGAADSSEEVTQDDEGDSVIEQTSQPAEQHLASSSNTVALATEIQTTGREGSITVLKKSLHNFLFSTELTEVQAAFADLLRRDKAELAKSKMMMLITLCDRGGQERFLMTHAALMADSSDYSATAYMIVMDGTKSLADPIPQCLFRSKQGSEQLVMERFGPKTRRELLAYHMNCIKMAHPSVSDGPFLGQDYVKRAPVTFAVSTREDETKNMNPKFLEEQEEILQDVVQKNKFGEHMVLAEKNPNKLTFRVDNTRSGTKNPDPVVMKVKEIFVAMVRSLWSQRQAIPLPWAVLDKLLGRVSQLAGNEGKILDIDEVCELARKFCDIVTVGECRSALKYLSSLSTIAFYSNVSELERKVFTDLQWLVNVLTVFVTIFDKKNIPPYLWEDIIKVENEGLMSWHLAQYLLENEGVNESQFVAILQVMHLFDIICPMNTSPEMPKSVLAVGQSFFIPCLLAQIYERQMVWQQNVGSTRFPPSLIFRPEGFDATPEPIYFRLVSRCASEYAHPRPMLKRRYAVFHVNDDLELDLELVYHKLRYIIATVYFPNDEICMNELIQQCSITRQFLIRQLNEVKKRGLDGIKFTVCVKPPPTEAEVADLIDDDCLVCIDEYPQQRSLINRKNERVPRKQFPTLDLWFNDAEKVSDGAIGRDARQEDELQTRYSLDFDTVRDAVVKHGCNQWYEIGLKLGLNGNEIKGETHVIPTSTGKMLAVIEAKWMKDGKVKTAQDLLRACYCIPTPIGKQVKDELKKERKR